MSSKSSNRDQGPVSQDFTVVGWVQSAHGIKGELEVKIASGDSSWVPLLIKEIAKKSELSELSESNEGIVQLQGIPFHCEAVRKKQEALLLRVRGVEDRTKAETMKSASFAIPGRYLISNPGETIYLKEILQFAVFDQDLTIGVIQGFSSNGSQDLLQVSGGDGEEFEIPFVAAFIKEIDFKGRRLLLHLPEGLLEINKK